MSYQTALKYVKEGKVASIQIGGRHFITDRELKRFEVEGNQDSANTES